MTLNMYSWTSKKRKTDMSSGQFKYCVYFRC